MGQTEHGFAAAGKNSKTEVERMFPYEAAHTHLFRSEGMFWHDRKALPPRGLA